MHIRRDELLELFRRRRAELKHAYLPRPALLELDVQPVRVPQVTREAITGTRAHRLDADLDPAGAPGGALLDTLRADGEAAVVHVPDRQPQRREALEVVPGKMLLAVAEIDGLVQFTQLRKRSEIGENGTLGVYRPRVRDVP